MSLSHLDNLLINLRIIGRLEENGRVSTTSRTNVSIEKETWGQGVKRLVWKDSRKHAYEAIKANVNAVFEISSQLLDSNYLNDSIADWADTPAEFRRAEREKIYQALKNVSRDLRASIKGISNLSRTTYNNDVNIQEKLQQIIQNIELHVSEIDKKIATSKTTSIVNINNNNNNNNNNITPSSSSFLFSSPPLPPPTTTTTTTSPQQQQQQQQQNTDDSALPPSTTGRSKFRTKQQDWNKKK